MFRQVLISLALIVPLCGCSSFSLVPAALRLDAPADPQSHESDDEETSSEERAKKKRPEAEEEHDELATGYSPFYGVYDRGLYGRIGGPAKPRTWGAQRGSGAGRAATK